jgi:hypothetical protein
VLCDECNRWSHRGCIAKCSCLEDSDSSSEKNERSENDRNDVSRLIEELSALTCEVNSLKQSFEEKLGTLNEQIRKNTDSLKKVQENISKQKFKSQPHVRNSGTATPTAANRPRVESDLNAWRPKHSLRGIPISVRGTNSDATLRTAPAKPQATSNKVIHVTRIHRECTTADVRTYMRTITQDANILRIVKLQAKHESYSSFAIEVPNDTMATLLDPPLWPEAVYVREFKGRLREVVREDS